MRVKRKDSKEQGIIFRAKKKRDEMIMSSDKSHCHGADMMYMFDGDKIGICTHCNKWSVADGNSKYVRGLHQSMVTVSEHPLYH